MADTAEDSSLGTTWPSSTSAEGEKGGEEGEPASFEMGAAGGRRKEKTGHRVDFVEEEGAEGEADDGGDRKGPKWRDVRSTVVHALFRSAEDERRPSRTRPKGANLDFHSRSIFAEFEGGQMVTGPSDLLEEARPNPSEPRHEPSTGTPHKTRSIGNTTAPLLSFELRHCLWTTQKGPRGTGERAALRVLLRDRA